MIFKYLCRTAGVFLWVLILTSCLGSNSHELELSSDAQIYTFSVSSVVDSNNYFSDTKFSIDQINGRIFNRDSLPYLFDVDSVKLVIEGKSTYGYTSIVFNLKDDDSTYVWNGKDSVAIHRLKSIETTAEDGKAKLKYEVSINIHQQDPYVINWDNIDNDYIQSPSEQKTISFRDKFITYYKQSGQVKASGASSSKGNDWANLTVTGLPMTVDLSSILSVTNDAESAIYALDVNNDVYLSTDGGVWNKIDTDYSVKAIYGELPMITGEFAVLIAVEDDGVIKFATTSDFTTVNLKDELPLDITVPISQFSAISFDDPTVYTAKYIILCGGLDNDGTANKELQILHEKNGEINVISEKIMMNIKSAELFIYDKRIYMLAQEDDKNTLYFSDNYGLNWKSGGENHSLPENFKLREGTDVISDSSNFMWIFGGKSVANNNQLVEVWRGRLNKLANKD